MSFVSPGPVRPVSSSPAEDFGIHFTTLYTFMKEAGIEDGERPRRRPGPVGRVA